MKKMAVVTSSDMLISQLTIVIFYNDLTNYEDEDNMLSGTKASIGHTKTDFTPELS